MRFFHATKSGVQRLFSLIVGVKSGIPAGAKPSGLLASVQEIHANMWPQRFPDHDPEIRPRPRKSSETNCHRFEAQLGSMKFVLKR
jgi:hypothetical protein